MAQTRSGYDPQMIPPPRAGHAPGYGPPPVVQPVRGPFGELPVADLRHPTEPSRFALALVAMAVPIAFALMVMVSVGQALEVIGIIVAIVVALLLIWVALQIWRIRLLGDAVLVSAQTLPAVQVLLDSVRERLGYTRRLDLFVVDKISRVLSGDPAPVTLTSFFGVHVLVAEGDAVGDLADPKERQQLLFTLATYVGALKSRHAQWWSPLFTAFLMTGLGRFAAPFVLPYYRATVYSGDRIAYACCGDLDVSLQAVYRALVGRDVAKHLRAEGFTGQALAVRRRFLLRFAQLLRATPHATNRYLELLAFVQRMTPAVYAAHRPSLAGAAAEVEPVLVELGGKRASPGVVSVGVTLAGAVLAGGLVLGVQLRDRVGGVPGDDGPTPTAGPTPAPGPTAPTTEELLLELLPSDMRSECAVITGGTTAVGSIECALSGDRPQLIQLHAFETADGMEAAVDELAAGLPSDDCTSGFEGRTTWSLGGATQGPLACFVAGGGRSTMVWGSTDRAVLGIAQDSAWSLTTMYEWWTTDAPHFQ